MFQATSAPWAEGLAIVSTETGLGALGRGETGYLASARPGDVLEVVYIGTAGDEAGWVYANLRYSETSGRDAGFGWFPAWALRTLDVVTIGRDNELQGEETPVPVKAGELLGVLCDSQTRERPVNRVFAYRISRPWERGWLPVPAAPEEPPRSAPELPVPAAPKEAPRIAPERAASFAPPRPASFAPPRPSLVPPSFAPPRPPGLNEAQAAARAALPAAPGGSGLPRGYPPGAAGGGAPGVVLPSAGYECKLARRSYEAEEKERRAEARRCAYDEWKAGKEARQEPGSSSQGHEAQSEQPPGLGPSTAPGGASESLPPVSDSGGPPGLPTGAPSWNAPRQLPPPMLAGAPPREWLPYMYHMRDRGMASRLRNGPCDDEAFVQTADGSSAEIRHNQRVEVLQRSLGDGWAEVQAPHGCMGWVRAEYLRPAPLPRSTYGRHLCRLRGL